MYFLVHFVLNPRQRQESRFPHVAQLTREGYPVHESDLAHIWPTRYEHINVYGRYHFNIEEARRRKGLRPLRLSGVNMP